MKKLNVLKFIAIFIFFFIGAFGENKNPKVVSLSPAVTETLFYFDLGDSVVGRTDFCIIPEANKIESMGSMFTPNVEKIVYTKADYIIMQSHYDIRMKEQLEKMGMKTILLDTPKSAQDILLQYERLLPIFNNEKNMELKIKEIKENIQSTKLKSEKMEKKPKVYYSLGSGHVEYTAGKDSFINDVIEIAGGENIVEDNGWTFPLEALIEKQPDFIIISQGKYDAMIKNSKYDELKVLKNKKRVILVEEDEITLATPRLLTNTLNKIQEAILNSDFFN